MSATAVKEKPILFSGPMVRAILDGRKTQTRRIVKPQPPSIEDVKAKSGSEYGWMTNGYGTDTFRPVGPVWAVRELIGREPSLKCRYGGRDGRLWVRESFDIVDDPAAYHPGDGKRRETGYKCRDAVKRGKNGERLVVDYAADTNTRVLDKAGLRRWRPSIHMPRWASRLTLEITDVRVERVQDVSEDDVQSEGCTGSPLGKSADAILFPVLWNKINGPGSWESNPWVWVISFRRLT